MVATRRLHHGNDSAIIAFYFDIAKSFLLSLNILSVKADATNHLSLSPFGQRSLFNIFIALMVGSIPLLEYLTRC